MFNCRTCPKHIRERCIQQSHSSPSIKMMMRHAFDARRDTQQMWGLLQLNCLRLPQGKRKAGATRASSSMTPSKGKPKFEENKEIKGVAPSSSPLDRPTKRPETAWRAEANGTAPRTILSRYCLALQGSQRRIALPTHGDIVLGRFDPATSTTPDVDLSYAGRKSEAISRRHARIVGHDGHHEIEDLGSTNGTMVNGERLEIGQKVRLRPGDQITLVYYEFVYGPMPEMHKSPHALPPPAYLQVTYTGHWFRLPTWGEVIIGRGDPAVELVPDIDLSQEGVVAQVVARRQAKIVARGGRHYVEDLGSTNGTKLNGMRLSVGERGLLDVGDHLWLGGCVLAYDMGLWLDNIDSVDPTLEV